MNQDCEEIIGHHIGKFSEVSMGDNNDFWGQYLCIRVVMDISNPLKHMFKLYLKEGSTSETLLLQYERLPMICFRCGLL